MLASTFYRSCLTFWVTHRLLAHRSYTVPRAVQFLLSVAAVGAWAGSPFAWAAKHHAHHKVPCGDSFFERGVGWVLEATSPYNHWHSSLLSDYHPYPELRVAHDWFPVIQAAEVGYDVPVPVPAPVFVPVPVAVAHSIPVPTPPTNQIGIAYCLGGWAGAWFGVVLPALLWSFLSAGFFAHSHAEGTPLTLTSDIFACLAALVSDEHNHKLHHMHPSAAYSQPYQLFAVALYIGHKLGIVTHYKVRLLVCFSIRLTLTLTLTCIPTPRRY